MNLRVWYETEALTAGLAVHRHTMMGGSEHEVETRIRDLYRDTVAVLVYLGRRTKAREGEMRWVERAGRSSVHGVRRQLPVETGGGK